MVFVEANGQCSPRAQRNASVFGTCMPPNYLKDIARIYNQKNKNPIPKEDFKSNKALVTALEARLGCSDEKCIVQSDVVQSADGLYQKLKGLYRPDMPVSWNKNMNTWLSNIDIEKVMVQYEDSNPAFKFVGVFPVDVYKQDVCGYYGMCTFNVFDFLATGKKTFGIIFNLDEHKGPGSHWVALYGCFVLNDPKFGFCYYDSAGRPPPKMIKDFLKDIKQDAMLFFKDQLPKNISESNGEQKTSTNRQKQQHLKNPFKTQFNVKEHQKKSSECGVFSMLFIIACLEHKKKTFNQICSMLDKGSDDYVQQYRKKLYRPVSA